MEYKFKKHEFNAEEKLWLQEVYNVGFREGKEFDPRVARVKLREKLPKDFDPTDIDSRFLVDGKNITLLGIYHIDASSQLLKKIEKVILTIKDLIVNAPGIEVIDAKTISEKSGLDEQNVEVALSNMQSIGHFYSGSIQTNTGKGCSQIKLTSDNDYNEYLYFSNLDDLLEKNYDRIESPSMTQMTQFGFVKSFDVLNRPYWVMPTTSIIEDKENYRPNTAFILMAMDPENKDLVDVHQTIKRVCKKYGINAYRCDEIEHQERITDRILYEIKTCEFVIADLSYERPNVYYEVGYAHAINKRPILFRKKDMALHFDLKLHNVPEYENITDLEAKLHKRLEAILGRTIQGE